MTESVGNNWHQSNRATIFLVALTLGGIFSAPFFSGVTLLALIIVASSVVVFKSGIFTRLAMTAFMTGIVGAISMQLTSWLGLKMNFTWLYVILLLLSYLYAWSFKDRISLRTSVNDVLGLSVGVATFLAIGLSYHGATTSRVLESLIPGEDNNSHFMVYRYTLTENRYAYSNSPADAGIRTSLLSYAQGSHAAMATLTAPFVEHSSAAKQLKAFVYSATAVFALAFWFAFLALIKPLEKIKNSVLAFGIGSLTALFYTIYVPLGVFISLYNYGYYPQNFSYAGLAFLLLISVSIADNLTAKAKRGSRLLLAEAVLLLLGFYAVFASWYLLTPIILPIFLTYIWLYWRQIIQTRWRILVLIIPMAAFCGYLAYIYLFKAYGADHLLTPAGVVRMNSQLVLVGLPAIFLAYGQWRRKQWEYLSINLSLLTAVFVAILVAVYQKKKIGHFDYYFYKSLFSVLFISIIYYGHLFCQGLASAVTDSYAEKRLSQALIWPIIGLFTVSSVLIYVNPPQRLHDFIKDKYSIAQTAPVRLLDVYTNPDVLSNYSDVIALSSGNPYTNFTGTLWGGAYFLAYDAKRENLENALRTRAVELGQPNSPLLHEIEQYAATKNKPVAVVIGDVYFQNTNKQNIINQLSLSKHIILIDVHGKPL